MCAYEAQMAASVSLPSAVARSVIWFRFSSTLKAAVRWLEHLGVLGTQHQSP